MGAEGLAEHADPHAVADAGPLIHLSEIGRLGLLRVFGALHVPEQVVSEAVRHGPVTRANLTDLGTVKQHVVDEERVADFRAAHGLQRLHTGELACFFLCLELGISIILCDDLASRDAAAGLGVTPVGSLGVIVRAFRRGLVARSEVERALTDLYDVSTLFLTRAIVDIALAELDRRGL